MMEGGWGAWSQSMLRITVCACAPLPHTALLSTVREGKATSGGLPNILNNSHLVSVTTEGEGSGQVELNALSPEPRSWVEREQSENDHSP